MVLQIDRKNGYSFHQVLQFVFVFVLSQESTFSNRFYFEANRKSWVLLKIGTRDFQNSRRFWDIGMFFYVTMTGYFERFSIFQL